METKSKAAQRDRIVEYIRENGSATIRDLFLFLNINSPSKRLSELRQLGLIREEWESRTNQSGDIKRYKRYFLTEGV